VASCGCKWLCCWRENPGEENQLQNLLKRTKRGAEECTECGYKNILYNIEYCLDKNIFGHTTAHQCVSAFLTKIFANFFRKLNKGILKNIKNK
jgi:hypothetical protein